MLAYITALLHLKRPALWRTRDLCGAYRMCSNGCVKSRSPISALPVFKFRVTHTGPTSEACGVYEPGCAFSMKDIYPVASSCCSS